MKKEKKSYGIDAEVELNKIINKSLKNSINSELQKSSSEESERMETLLEVYEKLSNQRSYTTGELLWDDEWLKERLFGEDLK